MSPANCTFEIWRSPPSHHVASSLNPSVSLRLPTRCRIMWAAARRALYTPNSSAARFPEPVTAFDEISGAAQGLNVWRRGRSFAATIRSDSLKAQVSHRRVSKEERHAMLKSFVDKYRESNEGRFPSISCAKKEVGGSYYTVRRMLQEIEHSYKVLPDPPRDIASKIKKYEVKTDIIQGKQPIIAVEVEKMIEEKGADHSIIARRDFFNEPLLDGVEISSGTGETSYDYLLEKRKKDSNFHPVQSAETSQNIKEAQSGLWQFGVPVKSPETTNKSFNFSKIPSITTAGVHNNQTELKKETDACFRESENIPGLHDSGGLDKTSTQNLGHEGSQSNNTLGEDSPILEHIEPTEKKSAVWANLKSFADGLINLWRKI